MQIYQRNTESSQLGNREWRTVNSWWVFLSFIYLGCVGFWYIGTKTGKKRWKVAGILYLILLVFGLFSVLSLLLLRLILPHIRQYMPSIDELNSEAKLLSSILLLIYLFATIIHSLCIRRKYLIYLDAAESMHLHEQIRDNRIAVEAMQSEQIRTSMRQKLQHGSSNQGIPESAREAKTERAGISAAQPMTAANMIDINACDEQQLRQLPGVNEILAKKALQYRAQAGNFRSVDQFCQFLHLSDRMTRRIKTMACVSGPVQDNRDAFSGSCTAGRRID